MSRYWALALVVCVWLLPSPALGQEEREWLFFGDQDWLDDSSDHWDAAMKYYQDGKNRRYLREMEWLLDNRPEAYPDIERNMTRGIVRHMYLVGDRYARAHDVLKERREALEKLFREGKGDYSKGLELHEINMQLGDWSRTLELYEELGREKGKVGKRMQRELFQYIEEDLIEYEQYDLLLKGAGRGPGNLDVRMLRLKRQTDERSEGSDNSKRLDGAHAEGARLNLCRSAARYYHALLGTDKLDDAEDLADKFLEYHKKPATYICFMRRAAKLKKYDLVKDFVDKAKSNMEREPYRVVKKAMEKMTKKKKKKKSKTD